MLPAKRMNLIHGHGTCSAAAIHLVGIISRYHPHRLARLCPRYTLIYLQTPYDYLPLRPSGLCIMQPAPPELVLVARL